MALTQGEQDEIKVLFRFPLELGSNGSGFNTRSGSAFMTFSKELRRTLNHQDKAKICEAVNGKDVKFRTKNIVFKLAENDSSILMNEIVFSHLIEKRIFDSKFRFDLMKSQRMYRLYTEYVIEKLNKAFNP